MKMLFVKVAVYIMSKTLCSQDAVPAFPMQYQENTMNSAMSNRQHILFLTLLMISYEVSNS